MTTRIATPWLPVGGKTGSTVRSHDRLRVPAAILDAVCVSALLWLTILVLVR